MGDQEGKIKNQYISWSPEETKTLLRLLVDGVNQNWTDASGKFNKLTVEQRILPELNKICRSKKTFSQYKNKTKILKKRHKGFVDLLRFSSRFGWDKDTKKFTAPNEVWNEYLQGHKKDTYLRDDTFEDFEDQRRSMDKILQKEIILWDEISAITGTTNQIVSMIQQRWQKEAEEKEAEEKVNKVWGVIKEIPDLEGNERFDAMNLVHRLGMKAGFMSMTREERFRWIKRSVRKP
ncbi:hypothetical protein HID58_084588 [Brassica napus]|uniref:(rape) hypothetical protein n=1 Tax=Brassica napus TaxID=3708 RepID=A0A816IPM1_BRANA|nr:hypothetical protein HID58_084588 [Brassica napus]CAF1716322.1 unnamed protein product [Brassica napus]